MFRDYPMIFRISRISKILRIGTEVFLDIYVLAVFDWVFKYYLLIVRSVCARLISFIGYKSTRIPIVRRLDYLDSTDRLFLV